jgi:PAS domain S-box-containing protein
MSASGTGEHPEPHVWGPSPLLALSAALLFSPFAAAASPATSRLVVMLYPQNDDGSPGHAVADQGLRAAFAAGSTGTIEVYAEYLDVAQPRGAGDGQIQVEYLRRKYGKRKVDLVISGLSPALDFALEHRAEVFPGVPIVFCAVDYREVMARKLPPDVVGAPITMDLTATLDVALRLHPSTQRICVVAGQSRMDATWVAEARREFQKYENRLEVVYLTGLPLQDLLRQVANLPEHTLIYYIHMFQDGTGRALAPAQVLDQLAHTANAPIYGHVDTFVGRGIVGGRVFSFDTAVKNAARISLRILAGERPETIGVLETSESTYLFDWRQLKRWGISEDSLPPGSAIRNKEQGFWDLYKWPAIGVVSLCVIEALLISGLLVQRSNRWKIESALQASEWRYRTLFEKANDAIFVETEDDGIVAANQRACDLLGYSHEELLAKTVPDLQAPEVRGRPGTVIKGELANHPDQPFEALDVHRDGRRIPVEIADSVIEEDGKRLVLSIVRDITERKQAEEALRESQRESRMLTSRLLLAQETERRRIARELHDDLNQSLALLAVELDLLGQKPAESATQFAGRVRKMSARVKDLSSTVHDLSHRLHPSKLEQLGLVAAVRSLCRELTQGHRLPIECTHHEVPGSIPEDTALCLYRIVQEALRNVVKHSGAQHAGVELSGTADAIRLRIVDDGIGFAPGSVDGKCGLGLVGMRERLHLVHGEITIDSRPSAGTRIDVRVPLGRIRPAGEAIQDGWERQDGEVVDVSVVARRP